MKKTILLIALLITIALTTQAQKCVVLDFQVGEDVTSEEVESVTFEFRSNFNPSCYKVEDFFRVKRILMDLHYDPATMKKEQIRKFGRDMVAAVVVHGTLNKYMDEYSLDVNVLDISTGTTIINQYNTFQKTEYRDHTKAVAIAIASKLCNMSTNTTATSSSSTQTSVQTPTQTPNTIPEGYTDLGLPSRTLWKNFNATGRHSHDAAKNSFGNRLPTKEQWQELIAECQWTWTGSGYKVTGPNGKSITLPAEGYRNNESGEISASGKKGEYWASTVNENDSSRAYYLTFTNTNISIESQSRSKWGDSVRLVTKQN